MLADMGTWRPPAYTLHDLCNNSLSERCGGSCSLATGGAATYFSGQISSNYLPNKLADVPYVIVLPTMGTLPPQPLSLSLSPPLRDAPFYAHQICGSLKCLPVVHCCLPSFHVISCRIAGNGRQRKINTS